MSQKRSKPRQPGSRPRKSLGGRWTWRVILLGVPLLAILAFAAFRFSRIPEASPLKPSLFSATVENKAPSPGYAPEGMVWIPGGEFSMGSDESGESLCGLPGVTRDAQPIHRVYVDG